MKTTILWAILFVFKNDCRAQLIDTIFDPKGNVFEISRASLSDPAIVEVTRFYISGNIREIYSMRNGIPDGPFVEYFPAGHAKVMGNYSSGARVGNWIWYDPVTSNVIRTGSYAGGMVTYEFIIGSVSDADSILVTLNDGSSSILPLTDSLLDVLQYYFKAENEPQPALLVFPFYQYCRSGVRFYYDSSGLLIEEEVYENCKLESAKVY